MVEELEVSDHVPRPPRESAPVAQERHDEDGLVQHLNPVNQSVVEKHRNRVFFTYSAQNNLKSFDFPTEHVVRKPQKQTYHVNL